MPRTILVLALLLAAAPAQARFGKAGSSPSVRAPRGASSSTTHRAVPVTPGTGTPPRAGSPSAAPRPRVRVSPWGYGFYSGLYAPWYGYGYGYGHGYWVGPPTVSRGEAPGEEAALRVTAGVEAMLLLSGESGVALGVLASFEGEQVGLTLGAQNITVKSLDGPGTDNLQQVSARLTWAFLSGKHGRLRMELGGDAFFTPDMVALAPSGGFSGTLGIYGPLVLEGSFIATPWPVLQLDGRAGLAVGLGPVGLRAGWRAQLLDDRGVVDGVVHRDLFTGPYVGASIVF